MPSIDVGAPPNRWSNTDTFIICYHKFKDLPSRKGTAVESSSFECLGMSWNVLLYPGGNDDSMDGSIAVGIHCHMSSEPSCEFRAKVMINIKKPNGRSLPISGYLENPWSSYDDDYDEDEGPFFYRRRKYVDCGRLHSSP